MNCCLQFICSNSYFISFQFLEMINIETLYFWLHTKRSTNSPGSNALCLTLVNSALWGMFGKSNSIRPEDITRCAKTALPNHKKKERKKKDEGQLHTDTVETS